MTKKIYELTADKDGYAKWECQDCDLETDFICNNCKARIDAETKKERDEEWLN